MKNATRNRRTILVEIIAALLLIYFIHTLISSYIGLLSLKNMLAFYTKNTALVAWLIISAEAAIVLLLFFPRTRLVGLIVAFLLVSFAGVTMLRFPYYPHHFGGIFYDLSRSQRQMLVICLGLLSITGIILSIKKKKPPHQTQNEKHVVTFT